jgi:hypothetical protein
MSNSIKIHRPTNHRDQWDADENTPRTKVYEAVIEYDSRNHKRSIGEEVAEYMFHILNAPEDMLSEVEINIANDFRAPGNYSLSTGDIVEVDGVGFLCESFGWKEVTI